MTYNADAMQRVIDDLDAAVHWLPDDLKESVRLASMLLLYGPDEIDIPTDAELLGSVLAEGKDPDEVAAQVRRILLDAVEAVKSDAVYRAGNAHWE